MISKLSQVHKPSNKGSLTDNKYMLLSQVAGIWRIQIKAESMTAQDARAFAAWLFVAADWIDAHE